MKISPARARSAITLAAPCVLWVSCLAFAACDGGDGGGDADAGDTDTGTGTDGDTDTDTAPDAGAGLGIEAHEPADGAVVPMNRMIVVRFAAAEGAGSVDPDTVQLLVDGEPVRAWAYYDDAYTDNREFHYVPFPVWEPSSEHEVTVAAGAAYEGDPSIALAGDFTWSFSVEDAPFLEEYDPETTPGLTGDELALAGGADAGPYGDGDIVNDWADPESSLHDVSVSVRPEDPDVAAFVQRMLESLDPLMAVGLAAPQVGVNRRLFVAAVNGERRAFINPVVESWSEDELYYGVAEGCLSIDGVTSVVARPASLTVGFDTPEGGHVTGYALENYPAKVWLHEYDHLNGILMTDREERRDW